MKKKDENKLTIKIPKKMHEISELSYDENDDNFSITIVSKKNKINPSDLIFNAPIALLTQNKERSNQFAQVLGRALARTRENKLFLSSWSFVSLEDIRKSKAESKSANFFNHILEEIIRNIPPQPIAIIFWQDKNGIWCIIKPNSRDDIFEKMKEKSNFSSKDNYLIAGPYTNFSEAELEIRKAIKEVIQ
ncbi:MAG: hypothetical protein NUV64_02010 [Parcubacteria group bacterium]|nr:hypothetical protein [Parcubacteria group bacterium]MCR4342787.1 hypothetical protein [Patescibacteria group bacterium]